MADGFVWLTHEEAKAVELPERVQARHIYADLDDALARGRAAAPARAYYLVRVDERRILGYA